MSQYRYPDIRGSAPEQLQRIKSFLHQLVEELNRAAPQEAPVTAGAQSKRREETSPAESFQAIKGLIIKSAEIAEAYGDIIEKRLEGVYAAKSEFGTFREESSLTVSANSQRVEQAFRDLQSLRSQVAGAENAVLEVTAHIRSGLLYYDGAGLPVYGLEVGQRALENGEELFHRYARFAPEKLSFYDGNGSEVAYISNLKLFITHAQITGSLLRGGFQDTVQADGSLVTKWVGSG